MTDPLQQQILNMPCWQATPMVLQHDVLGQRFLVQDDELRYWVKRGESQDAELQDRWQAEQAASTVGVAPKVIYCTEQWQVTQDIGGRPLTQASLDDMVIKRLADVLLHFHLRMPQQYQGVTRWFWLFDENRCLLQRLAHGDGYAEHQAEHSSHGQSKTNERLLAINDSLEMHCAKVDVCLGHHNLQLAHIIDDNKRLWLTQLDSVALGTPLQELALFAQINGCSTEQQEVLVDAYFAGRASSAQRLQFDAYYCAAVLHRACLVWSELQASKGAVDDPTTLALLAEFEVSYARYLNTAC